VVAFGPPILPTGELDEATVEDLRTRMRDRLSEQVEIARGIATGERRV
jgi:hypothetical protein